MSFDIFFQTGRFTGKPVVKKNPFTGEAQTVLPEGNKGDGSLYRPFLVR